MPLLTSGSTLTTTEARIVRLEGLPDFNAGDSAFKVFQFDGFFDAATPSAVLAPNGGGAGAVASGAWLPQEQACLLVGRIKGAKETLPVMRRLLLAALPAEREVSVVFPGSGWDVDLQMFVRRYDRAGIDIAIWLDFSIPLIAADPYKYAIESLAGAVGVFTGEDWYDTYFLVSGTTYASTYAGSGSAYYRTYTQAASTSPLPVSLTLTSDGDASSQRVTIDVSGPLAAGDWWLLQETTGAQLWVDVSIAAGQTLTLDCLNKTADLGGSDVTHLVYGDYFTLEPGSNTYRLTSGTDNDEASASLTALAAYQ